MKTAVADASVAAKWFAIEPGRDLARNFFLQTETIKAPDLILAEIGNVAWKKALRGEMTVAQARAAPAVASALINQLVPIGELIERAIGIALELRHSVYDSLYLACAETESGILVTEDQRLATAVRGTQYEALVASLASAKSMLGGA